MKKNVQKRLLVSGFLMALIAFINPFSSSAQTYCNPTYPSGCGSWGTSGVTIGTFTHSPACNTSNYLSQTVSLDAGATVAVSLVSQGWCGVGMAADFNNDGDFEDADEILALPSYVDASPATYSFSITIPPHVLTGNYRLRIWNRTANASGANNGVVPCGTYGYGRFQDYTLNITNTATCYSPSGLSIIPGSTTAALSWIASTSAPANYDWKVVVSGSNPNTDPGVASGTTSNTNAVANGLNSSTSYQLYVQSTCSITESSVWSLPSSFVTLCDGTPDGGTALASVTSVCVATSFNLSLAGNTSGPGISYQWQSSPAGGGTYVDIPGATSPTYAATQSVAQDYICVITCAGSGLSSSSSVVAVAQNPATSCYCIPTVTSTSYYITSFSTTGGTTNITNNGTGLGAYNDYSATMSASAIQGNIVNFSLTGNSTFESRAIYIDWNQNGVFTDAGELVYSNNSTSSATVTGSFTVPFSALSGNTRMRVRTTYYSGYTMAPCGLIYYGETEDYTFNTLPVSGICVFPINLGTSGITNTAATVTFSPPPAGNTPTSYIYELRTDGTTAGTGSVGLVAEDMILGSPINFTNLAQGSTYTLFIRTFCSTGDSSSWASIPFSTNFDTLTPVALNGFNFDVIANGTGNATVSTNNDVDGAGYALVAADFKATPSSAAPAQSLPLSRTIQNILRKYRLNYYNENNSLRMSGATSGTIRFLAPKRANKVYVMGVSGSGATTQTAIVHFRDGTTQSAGQFFPDWYASGNNVTANNGRVQLSNNALSTGPYLHDTAIVIATGNRNKQIDSISFNHTGAVMNVLAVSIVPNTNQPCALPAGYGLATNITSSGADVAWTGNGTNTAYQISYGLEGTFVDQGTIIAITGNAGANTANLTGMTSAANQQVYFRTDCGAGSYSDWIGPITFTTLADNCAGIPAIGTLTASATTVCSNVPYSLSVANVETNNGIELKWQSSPTGAGTWTTINTVTPVIGTTTYSYAVATQSASTDYRCVISCINSGDSSVTSMVTVAQNPFYECYCIPGTTTSTSADNITKVVFAGINKSSTTSTNGYSNYDTVAPAQVVPVQTYPIAVTVNNGGTEHVSVWIDYNHNGIFDTDEYKYLGSGNNVTINSNIVIPANALPGITRMRVRLKYNGQLMNNEPCVNNFTYGETEDYLVNIASLVNCAGTPSPGATISSVANICVSGTTALSLTNDYLTFAGITYQWQSSPDGTTWSDIASATAYNYTTPTITATTHYRCALTCSAAVGYSDPTVVQVHALPVVTVTPSQAAFCSTGSATLLASGATTYTWLPVTNLNVATGASVDASPAAITTYTVTGTDINGCVNSAATTVGPITAITPMATVEDVCETNVINQITVSPIATVNGTMEYALTDMLGVPVGVWQASNVFDITPATEGLYKYLVFARNTSCTATVSDTGTVQFYVGLNATVTVNDASCTNGDGSIVVTNPFGPGVPGGGLIWYSNDFSSSTLDTNVAALRGVATITTGGVLQLTPNSGSQNGGLVVKNPAGITGNVDSVNFLLNVPQNGADGVSWSFGNDIVYDGTTALESGAGSKLILSFDSYGGSGVGVAGIYLTYGQAGGAAINPSVTPTMLAYSNNTSWRQASNTKVSVYISPEGKFTLKLGTNVIFNQVQLPADYVNANRSSWTHLFAARTGGVSELHSIDNLNIYYSGNTYTYGSAAAGSGMAPTSWQSSNIFGGLNGGDSLDIWMANPTNPTTCNKFLGTYGVSAPVVTSLYEAGDPSCIGTDDGYLILAVNVPGTFDVSYTKNGGSPINETGLVSGNDGITDFVFFTLPQGLYDNVTVTSSSSCVSNSLGPITLTGGAANGIVLTSYTTAPTNQSGAGTQYYADAACDLIAAINSPNNLGLVTASVTVNSTPVTASNGEPFLGRYYEIEPSLNATLPATITLYFSVADFAAYNASALGTYPALLTDGSNLRVTVFHGGAAGGNTGPNGQYDLQNAELIQPSSIVLNSSNYWEVTFYTPNGFSGFFANTNMGIPLNISLGNVTAQNAGSRNVINWRSKTENSGNYFIVEHSKDGKSFKQLDRIAGKGIDNSNYDLVDSKPNTGINYYRVIMTNVEGQKVHSNIVSAVVKTGDFDFNVYPNPVNNELSIKVSAVSGKGYIEVSDVTGRIIGSKEVTANGTASIDMHDYTSGIYLITYRDDVQVSTIKVNKN